MMKKLMITMAVVATATVLHAGAPVRIDTPMTQAVGNWYVGAYGGMNVWQSGIDCWHITDADEIPKSRKIGWNAGFKVGYDFDPAAAVRPVLEVEAFYNAFTRGHTFKSKGKVFGTEKFTVNSQAMMANALAKFDAGTFQPYAGAGLGVYTLAADMDLPSGHFDNYKATGLAWQLLAGSDYKLCANWALFAEYKWLNYEIAGHKNKPRRGDHYTQARIGQQLVNLGVRYSF